MWCQSSVCSQGQSPKMFGLAGSSRYDLFLSHRYFSLSWQQEEGEPCWEAQLMCSIRRAVRKWKCRTLFIPKRNNSRVACYFGSCSYQTELTLSTALLSKLSAFPFTLEANKTLQCARVYDISVEDALCLKALIFFSKTIGKYQSNKKYSWKKYKNIS